MLSLEEFLVTGVYAFMLIFTRLGTAMMIMPGIGDSFVPKNIRLMMSLGMAFVLTPVVQQYVPSPVAAVPVLFSLILMEFVIGLFIGTMAIILLYTIGTGAFFLVHMPIVIIAGTVGVWLFYVQHQFETTHWEAGDKWNPQDAALYGSSHYDLPFILRWATANIGAHHIHHLQKA